MTDTVLITGISGYIGLHCAAELLHAGYRVRGSVRSLAKEQEVRDTLNAASVDTTALEFVELDLTEDAGWNEAALGCTYVLHVASPFAVKNPKTEDEMIVPAVQGTLRALKAAKRAGVKRVVLTGSVLNMMGDRTEGNVAPTDWTNPNSAEINTYTKSKTLAEKAAWAFIERQTGEHQMEMVAVNPGAVMGPPVGHNISGQSMDMVDQLLKGKMPMLPQFSIPMVDVRDVAVIHLRAMTAPEAAGTRILAAAAEPRSYVEVAQILVDNGYTGPTTRKAPNFLLKFAALFDREAKGMLNFVGRNVGADNSETRELLDWTPLPFHKTILDTAKRVSAAA